MTTPQQLEADLGWALLAVLRSYHEISEGLLAVLPGGPRGYHVLATAMTGEPPSQLALARKLGVDRTVMTYLLDAFEGCGLVERQLDPTDRRARRIVATDKGLDVLAAMDARVAAAEEELLAGLEPAQRALLRDLLERAATGTAPDDDRCRTVLEATVPPPAR